MLIPSLAKKIIQEVRRLIDEDIIIVDTTGTIIASTESGRLGNFHEGALLASRDQKKIVITKEMEETLQGVRAGINLPVLFQNKVVGVIGITGDPEKISPYGELLKKMTELLIQESYYAEQMELDSRTLETFVFDWLQIKEPTSEFLSRAELLGVEINTERQIVMASIHGASLTIKELSNHMQQLMGNEDLFVRWGNDRFLLLLTRKQKPQLVEFLLKLKNEFETQYNLKISFGVGQIVQGYKLRKSFDEAERALQVAKRISGIQFDDELTLEMLLQGISNNVGAEFVLRTIGDLLLDPVLIKTLQVFIEENQSIKQTSESLHIHVNTLHYRLQKIEEITGLHPRKFTDLATLYLGLLLEEYPKKNF
ncbi:CdaR family transcriptional regulator [Fredinandcohnia sp. 179-A 10B2 NHS]|uniref:CdaR family transcriptional regulator n=1 Tax=Fredinandcohnia sp. 179-A 10B2 NHS TaxID=3235176 RepID=UPI0039A36D7C